MAPIRMTLPFVLAAASLACGDGDGDGGGADAGADAGSDVDAPVAQCEEPVLDSELGELGESLEFRGTVNDQQSPGAVYLDIFAQLEDGPKVDIVNVLLFEGFGAFAGGIAPGTYPIDGPETDFYNCGACLLVVGDFDQATMESAQTMVASSGTLTLETVSTQTGEMVVGSLTDVSYREVTLDDDRMVQTNVPGGCMTHIEGVSFSVTLE